MGTDDSGITMLIPSICLCPSDHSTPFKQRRRRFWMKTVMTVAVTKAQEKEKFQHFAIYIQTNPPPFSAIDNCMWHFSDPRN